MTAIVHITHRFCPVIGGSEQYVWQIASRQVSAGNDVLVVATDAEEEAYFWRPAAGHLPAGKATCDGVSVHRLAVQHPPLSEASFRLFRRGQQLFRRFPKVARIFSRRLPPVAGLAQLLKKTEKLDTIFSWNILYDHPIRLAQEEAAARGARQVIVPFLHLGEGPGSTVRRYYTMPHQIDLLRKADEVIVQTSFERDFLIGCGLIPQKLVIAGAGVDPVELDGGDADAFRRQHDVGEPLVTAIGPLTYDKGTVHLLAAMQRLWSEGVNVKLALAGDMADDFRGPWSRLADQLREKVLILGRVVGAAKRNLLAATDVLALPSRTDSFGIVLLEAWLYGHPVIGADAGALPSVIENGQDGLIVPFGDVDELARALNRLIAAPDLAQRLGSSGRVKVLERYTWDKVYERFSVAYR